MVSEAIQHGHVPSIGRIVHYHAAGDAQPTALLVTAIHPDNLISGVQFAPWGEQNFLSGVPYSEDLDIGTWCWPVRVP